MYDEEFMQREELLQPAPEKVPVPVPAVSAGEDAERPLSRADRRVRAAFFLLCCFLLGAAGAGVAWQLGPGDTAAGQTAAITQPILHGTASGAVSSDAAVYAAAVNSVVSINTINTASRAGVNIFGQPVQSASSGSGFILNSDGYILTNYHVVQDASAVEVTTYSGEVLQARVVGGDADYDIAVLKVDASGLQSAALGDSDTLNVGDRVLAIGNPLGELTFSMSGGMVSSVNRAINVSGTPFHMIQTDTSINPGNSGGPLLNTAGEVVGIVSAKYSSSNGKAVEGIGFAIPINDVRAIVQDIIDNGYVTNKAYLGVTAGTVNAQMAQQGGLAQGVYLYAVDPGGAAAAAGLQVGGCHHPDRWDGDPDHDRPVCGKEVLHRRGYRPVHSRPRGTEPADHRDMGRGAGSRRIRFPKRTGTGARRLRPIWGPVRPDAVLRRVSGHRHAAGDRSPAVCFTDSLTAVSGLFNPPIYTEHRKTRIRPAERGIAIL